MYEAAIDHTTCTADYSIKQCNPKTITDSRLNKNEIVLQRCYKEDKQNKL